MGYSRAIWPGLAVSAVRRPRARQKFEELLPHASAGERGGQRGSLRQIGAGLSRTVIRRCLKFEAATLLSGAFHQGADGAKDDLQIQPWRRVFDVVEVVLELVQRVLGAGAVGIIDLRPAGQPRFDEMPLAV